MTYHDPIHLSYTGTALVCEVSARDGDGIENLIEGLLLQADVMELKAARAGQAEVSTILSSYIVVYLILSNFTFFILSYFTFCQLCYCVLLH
jgi:hypothetical protein